jgi:hypothetical protein
MANEEAVEQYEQELASYLQERIKPGLNRGAIPLLARSIAKEIARRDHPGNGSENEEAEENMKAKKDEEFDTEERDEPEAEDEELDAEEEEEEPEAEEDEEPEEDDEPEAEEKEAPDFEADMRDLQAELGEDWIVRFSVQGEDGWLTAEKEDGSQHVEAPSASVLIEAVELLNDAGGRSE